jgi:hypothetical protein
MQGLKKSLCEISNYNISKDNKCKEDYKGGRRIPRGALLLLMLRVYIANKYNNNKCKQQEDCIKGVQQKAQNSSCNKYIRSYIRLLGRQYTIKLKNKYLDRFQHARMFSRS